MITMQEMEKELAIYRKNFTAVRLISEADILRTIEARKHNPASRACPCRDGRMTSQGCRNCIVLRAYMEKCKKIKLEYDDPNVYQVTARYLHVEGGRYVLELVQNAKLPAPNVLLRARSLPIACPVMRTSCTTMRSRGRSTAAITRNTCAKPSMRRALP